MTMRMADGDTIEFSLISIKTEQMPQKSLVYYKTRLNAIYSAFCLPFDSITLLLVCLGGHVFHNKLNDNYND
ncbi:hypothetical protein DERF_009963 [Dermatophagoides farinae]|uniref:Uncharacterized protein n=1 Tax=Dermatophagoides farinae TaxID=6954 RepID=A0A922L1G7_DERFA|nr:hypothetical protein DERF_009963 [Dermatophagoides farinae]